MHNPLRPLALWMTLIGVLLVSWGAAQDGAGLPIAVQLYTLRDYGTTAEQFKFAAESGFKNVETVGTHDLTAEEMNALLDETGLTVVSTHVDMDTLRNDVESVIAFNQAIGNSTVVMPYADMEDAAGWQELGRELNDIGAHLREAGMQLAYHNHAQEMEMLGDKLAIDHLLDAAEPENLMWQQDVAWIDRGGQDPAQLLREHTGRVISIHAKDNYPEGEGADEGGFATVGSGRLDWSTVLPAAAEAGVQNYIVEHDQPADYQTIADSYGFLSRELPAVLGETGQAGKAVSTPSADDVCATYGLLEPHDPPNALTAEEEAEGWELLFDGMSTDAWRGFKQDAFPAEGWEVIGGCLVRAAEGGGDIITKAQFDDFELALEWRTPTAEPGNSGIFFNVTEEGEAVYETGPEMQILNNQVHPDGHDTRLSAGANYALHEPTEVTVMPAGMFNYARILVQGNHVEHWLNGVKIVSYELKSPEWEELVAGSKFADWPYGEADAGHIALQDHGDTVWFRNIKIRPLDAAQGESAANASGGEPADASQVQAAAAPVEATPDPRLADGELPVALQMYSLRTFGSLEGGVLEEQLALAADAGYSWIETVGTQGVSAEELNALLKKYNLKVASTHVDMDTLRNGLSDLIAFNETIGNTNIVMPYAEAEDAAGWQALGAELDDIGAQLREAGMQLAYHNHNQEMAMLGEKRAIDHLLDAADPQNLKLQADLAWVVRGGVDPVQFVSEHAGRIISVHAKDIAPEGQNEDQDGWAEVGYGTFDWDALLPAVVAAGAQWFVVEHDNPRDHLTVAQRGFEFLQDELTPLLGLTPRPTLDARIGGALQTVDDLTQGALEAAQAAAQAENVAGVKAQVGKVFESVWGLKPGLTEMDADAQALGWNERWRVSDPEHGVVGNGLYAREQLRDLQRRSATPEADAKAAKRADVALSNVIGWMWLDDGVLYGEKVERPRVDLTYVWDYPVEFWNSTADTGWFHEVYAQSLNILKTDYEGDTAMAQAHAQALVPLLERALEGEDANGNGAVEPIRMEGGLEAVMNEARASGWLGEGAER